MKYNSQLVYLYNLIENKSLDALHVIQEINMMKLTAKELKSFISLKLRYFLNNETNIIIILSELDKIILTQTLMKRDYWLIIDLYYKNQLYDKAIDIMKYINIETPDIDKIIENNWNILLPCLDGFPVKTSFRNIDNIKLDIFMPIIEKYHPNNIFNTSKNELYLIYYNKIDPKYRIYFDNMIETCDILIDGANIAFINTPQGPTYNFSELIILINKLIELNYKPMIILHERHKIPTNLYFLKKYIIKTPRNTYDDNYLIYGMCKKGINIISNDLFRDHLNNMNIFTKCYVESMTFKYIDKNIIIPKYTKCIQIINNMCYIPTDQGFYCLPTIALSTNSQFIDLVRL